MTTRRTWIALALAALLSLLALSACGDDDAGASTLGELPPTVTAIPHMTPTPLPEPEIVTLAAVDWDDVDHFRGAMRPEYADDIDEFVDSHRYYIEATLTFEGPTAVIRAAQRTRYTNHTGETLDDLVFRLYPNMTALGGRMNVYAAWLNDEPVEPQLAARDSALIIPLETPLAPGDSAEVMFNFTVTAERGIYAAYGEFGFQRDILSAPEWYVMIAPYDAGDGWWMDYPTSDGDASYGETGLFEIFLTVPEQFVVAISGTEIDRFAVGDGMQTLHVVSGPMRDNTIVAGPLFGKITDEVDGITVNIYYWPGDEPAAEELMEISRDSLRVNNRKYGDYPYNELDVVETFHFSAMEYPGLVFVSERFWERGNNFMETATVHEIGHQWFYSLVGNDQVNHPWIDESLTSFTEYIYMREVYGEDAEFDYIQNDRDSYNGYRGAGGPDLVLNLPVSTYSQYDFSYGAIVYTKGALFFYELETLLGRDTFEAAVQTYFDRFRYRVAESRDILETFEEVSGEDLDELFYQWVGEFEGLDPAVIDQFEDDDAAALVAPGAE